MPPKEMESRSIVKKSLVMGSVKVDPVGQPFGFAPWQALEERGAVVRYADFKPADCTLDMEDLAGLINERTRLVAVGYASNAVGTINDVRRIAEMAHEVGATLIVDSTWSGLVTQSPLELGADVVIGHGPHVPRAVEVYEDRFIAYSLGNFWTYGRFNLRGPNGMAPVVDLELAPDGRLNRARIHSARQEGRGGPRIDRTGSAYELIGELTANDLPEARLEFAGDGLISWPGMRQAAQEIASDSLPQEQSR